MTTSRTASLFRFLVTHRRAIRITNLRERMFGKEPQRTKVIPHVFGERAVLNLIYATLSRALAWQPDHLAPVARCAPKRFNCQT